MRNTNTGDFLDRHQSSRDRNSQETNFSAPLGRAKNSRLVFASGASELHLTSDPTMTYLYQAHFKHNTPRVWLQDDILTVEYNHFPFISKTAGFREPLAEISMNGSIPWEIEFRHGVSFLNAELATVQLNSLDILGGANQLQLSLSTPLDTTFIYISGGIRQGVIHIPLDTALRVQVRGGASHMRFEDQRFEVDGGEISLETPNFESATQRYDICIAGGVNEFSIDRESEP